PQSADVLALLQLAFGRGLEDAIGIGGIDQAMGDLCAMRAEAVEQPGPEGDVAETVCLAPALGGADLDRKFGLHAGHVANLIIPGISEPEGKERRMHEA